MDFSYVPSLKHATLVKIAISLLNQDDIQKLILNCPKIKSYRRFELQKSIELVKKEVKKKVENKVLKYMLKLSLPDLLKNQLLSFVEAISWQLIKWKERHAFDAAFMYKKNFAKFCWTPQGTIDRKKTAELYASDESISVDLRYVIACEACSEDCIYTLWKQLKGWRHFKTTLPSYWSHYMKGKLHLLKPTVREYCSVFEISPFVSLNEYMFRCSVQCSDLNGTAYFLQNLTHQEKESVLLHSAIKSVQNHTFHGTLRHAPEWCTYDGETFAENAIFLISNLNKEQRDKVFRQYPYDVLKCFLIWPMQIFFMELAKLMFCCPSQISSSDYKPEELYYRVLKEIASKIATGSIDYNYRKLLLEFWHEGHYTYKKFVINNYASDSMLSSVFKFEDTGNIKLVLKDVVTSRKRKTFCD